MQERSIGAIDEAGWVVEIELAHVPQPKVELDTSLGCPESCLLDHRR
jgi:hypothetical protein